MKNKGFLNAVKKLAVLTMTLVTVGLISFCFSFESKAVSYVGVCGKNVEWYLDSRTETLRLNGEGTVDEYENYLNDILNYFHKYYAIYDINWLKKNKI